MASDVRPLDELSSIRPQTAPWRQAFFDMSWRRWEFWLFFGRRELDACPRIGGTLLSRLAEDWGDGPAIVGTACFFTFAHSQYQIPNLYNAGMIVGVFLSALGFGVVLAWTRSRIRESSPTLLSTSS